MNAADRLDDCFQRAVHLTSIEKNYDYAHTLFAECVSQDPGNIAYAEALVANLKAKAGNRKKKSWHLLGMKGEREFKQALSASNWTKVLSLGVDILRSDAWHVPTLRGMAQACQSLHHNDVELVYLKQALEGAPRDIEVNRHCARSLARMGQFDQAIACWHRVEEITGGNAEAARMITQLAEDKIQFAGRHAKEGGSHKEKRKADPRKMATDEDSQHESDVIGSHVVDSVQLTPRQRLEKAIRDDPAEVINYLKLSQVLCDDGYFEKAEELLAQAIHNCAQTSVVQEALRKVQVLHADATRAAAEIERQKQRRAQGKPLRVPWLELILTAAGAILVLQLVPSWRDAVLNVLTAHIQVVLIVMNVVVLAGLIGWRQWKR